MDDLKVLISRVVTLIIVAMIDRCMAEREVENQVEIIYSSILNKLDELSGYNSLFDPAKWDIVNNLKCIYVKK